MAIFQTKFEPKSTLDDTQEITCEIESYQIINGHTEYILKCQRRNVKGQSWKILRRYNDFFELNKCLRTSGLPFPGKKLIGNLRPEFVAERRRELQAYLNAILMNPILASSLPTKKFVDPDNYSSSLHDQAFQNATLCLRSEELYVLGGTMGAIGWRLRKHYFKVSLKPQNSVNIKSSSKPGFHFQHSKQNSSEGNISTEPNTSCEEDLTLTWTEYGPDKKISDKDVQGILKSLIGLQHSFIEPIKYAIANENGALIIRKFYKQGSLKDALCFSSPKDSFVNKYGNPKNRTTLTIREVALFGKQILIALIFLHSKGLPHGHLHSGNIIIEGDEIRLLDIENFLLGVPSFYRPFFVQHSKIHSPETIDVYCFGHVLFEMSMGYPLQESFLRHPLNCPELLGQLLDLILSKDACKSGLPTLNELIEHQFFVKNVPSSFKSCSDFEQKSKSFLKLSASQKESIKLIAQKTEMRLKEEQKSVKNQKRIVRVQEMMSSEEEKRKLKQKSLQKQEHRHCKIKQQNSLQLQNGSSSSLSTASLNRTMSIMSVEATPDANSIVPASSSTTPCPPSPLDTPVSCNPGIVSQNSIQSSDNRSVLLDSISKFNRASLRKVKSND